MCREAGGDRLLSGNIDVLRCRRSQVAIRKDRCVEKQAETGCYQET